MTKSNTDIGTLVSVTFLYTCITYLKYPSCQQREGNHSCASTVSVSLHIRASQLALYRHSSSHCPVCLRGSSSALRSFLFSVNQFSNTLPPVTHHLSLSGLTDLKQKHKWINMKTLHLRKETKRFFLLNFAILFSIFA